MVASSAQAATLTLQQLGKSKEKGALATTQPANKTCVCVCGRDSTSPLDQSELAHRVCQRNGRLLALGVWFLSDKGPCLG